MQVFSDEGATYFEGLFLFRRTPDLLSSKGDDYAYDFKFFLFTFIGYS